MPRVATSRSYTVLVARPDANLDDMYVAFVMAPNPRKAEDAALRECIGIDRKEHDKVDGPFEDCGYAVAIVFDGHCEVAKYGWQA